MEFYASKLDPAGWLDDAISFGEAAKAKADNITAALRSVEQWSNWDQEGRIAVRGYAWSGDLFAKIATREKDGEAVSVYRERIDPRHVKDFDKDERGHFTYLKVAVPKTRRLEDGETEGYAQTEVWDKERGTYEVYERSEYSIDELGELVERVALSTTPVAGDFDGFTGYDFVPVVHVKFRDIGADRGLSAFGHALGGIREADSIATALHDMLFPDEPVVLKRSGLDPMGNPLPPIQLEDNTSSSEASLSDGKGWARGYPSDASQGTVRLGKTSLVRLPSGGELDWKIPNRDLSVAAGALAEQVKELEREMPELAYSRLRELELSGRAIRYSMADVYDRHNEAHRNLAQGIVRLNQMALTIGQVVGLAGFEVEAIGEYGTPAEAGAAFEHSFEPGDPFPSSRADEAEADILEYGALEAAKALGSEHYRRALVKAGWSEADAKKEADKLEQESAIPPIATGGRLGFGTLEDTATGPGQVPGEE